AALCLGLALGCNKNTQAPAKVSGRVTYKGKALPSGSIAFNSTDKDKPAYASPIGKDGTYQITDLPTGEMVVTVETESANPKKDVPSYGGGKGDKMYAERIAAEQKTGGAMMAKGVPPEYMKIPPKYNNPKTSPLTVTIKAGR